MMNKVVLATSNPGKVRELSTKLAEFGMDILAQSEFGIESAEETGLTFVENALIKARHASRMSGLPAIADDSGIAIDYLNGQPGIFSARFAGADATDSDNIDKVLTQLKGVPKQQRDAAFHCVLVYLRHAEDPVPVICQGIWQGRILETKLGEQGFGYDPIFWSPEFDCSAAQLSKEEKNAVSHRGKALQKLFTRLREDAEPVNG